MKQATCSFNILERDDGVLIEEIVGDPDFQTVQVELQDGIELKDIEDEDVALIMSEDGKTLKFERVASDEWDDKFDEWTEAGLNPVGFGITRFYPTLEAYEKDQTEMGYDA